MSFSSRLKEKQEQESRTGSTTRRNRSEEPATPVNTFLARREERERERERERQVQLKQAVQQDHSKEKSDFFRADREQAAKEYARLPQNRTPILSSYLTGKHENSGTPYAPVMQDTTSRQTIESRTRTAISRRKRRNRNVKHLKEIWTR